MSEHIRAVIARIQRQRAEAAGRLEAILPAARESSNAALKAYAAALQERIELADRLLVQWSQLVDDE